MGIRNVVCLRRSENEPQDLSNLVQQILATLTTDVLVIGPCNLACDPRVFVVPTTCNGITEAFVRGYHRIFFMDTDLSHQPRYLPEMNRALHEADIVIGSRYVENAGRPHWGFGRYALSRVANRSATALLRAPFRDATATFTGYRREVLQAIDIETIDKRSPGFQIELKYRAHRLGFTLLEVPIRLLEPVAAPPRVTVQEVAGTAVRLLRMKLGVDEPKRASFR